MTKAGIEAKRTDTATRTIKASPDVIYRAFLTPEAVAAWRPPQGMKADIFAFEPRVGGGYRMAFAFEKREPSVRGKTTENADVFRGEFVELVPNERIVECVDFESDDPAFAGTKTITTTFTPTTQGTDVIIRCENVPYGITALDHQIGIASTLNNLAAFTE